MKIPKCMSTQHPDNVNSPFFTDSAELGGEDEIKEAYYVFSHLGCEEQMWDYEGKEVDNFVVKKLLTRYHSFFSERKIGQDCFITLRVPNPEFEKAEAKILLETLESIPRSFDAAKLFYGENITPIFEVILPMTTSAESIDRVYKYYRNFVAGKQHKEVGGIKLREWIGEFMPKEINVIPLIEDMEHMLNSDKIIKNYLKDKNFEYQRVFLARSDPALNYGLISAMLINKIALRKLYDAERETGIEIYPIIGIGSAPFRGNLKPKNVESVIDEYKGVHTFTAQSAFKYDNPPEDVKRAIRKIKNAPTEEPVRVKEKMAIKTIEKYSNDYKNRIGKLLQIINRVSKYVLVEERENLTWAYSDIREE
jgi:phosphoenolpyruvate carboxylase